MKLRQSDAEFWRRVETRQPSIRAADPSAGPNSRQSGTAYTLGASGLMSRPRVTPRVTTRPSRYAFRARRRTLMAPRTSVNGRASVRWA